jgi:hypothetical protein
MRIVSMKRLIYIIGCCVFLFAAAFTGCKNDPLTLAITDDEMPAYMYLLLLRPSRPSGPAVAGVSPANGASDVPVSSNITVAFNVAMNPATVTLQAANGPCTGSVQISFNDFATCIGGVISTTNNRTFTADPAADLYACESFRVRVTTAALSAKGTPLAADYTQPNGFGTYGDTTADWTEDAANPMILGGGTDGVDKAYYPFVLKVGAVYHIWYGDGNNTRHASSYYHDFNDVTFPAPVVTGLVGTYPYHPRLLYNASGWDIGTPSAHYAGPFLMYYTDGNTWGSPRVAHSADGSSWTDIGACTGINSYGGNTTVYNLAVLYEGGTAWKGYADNGLGHIQYYTSSNGIDWTGQAMDIMGTPYQPWENSGAQGNIAPFIIMNGSTYVLFYSSGDARNDNAFGFATSSDGQNFTKSTGNPIFSIYDGVAWRDVRTYTTSIVQNNRTWLLYFTGRTNTPSTSYSVGFARRCGAMY